MMSSDPSASPEGSGPLPKATVPVQLVALPQSPSAATAPMEEPQEELPVADMPTAEFPEEESPEQDEPQPASRVDAAHCGGLACRAASWVRSLSIMEKFCCILILVGVVAFAAMVFVPALFDVADEPPMVSAEDFPIKGQGLEVRTAETYWREPVLDGANPETVRAGTVLIPVLDMKLSGKGEVRVLFRREDGKVVGDLVTLELTGDRQFAAACTDGFSRRGDFAAYQTAEIEPWVVEFHQVQAKSDAIGQDTLLFQMSIAPILK